MSREQILSLFAWFQGTLVPDKSRNINLKCTYCRRLSHHIQALLDADAIYILKSISFPVVWLVNKWIPHGLDNTTDWIRDS